MPENTVIKGFVCTVEDYNGEKKNCRVFASTAVQAREKLIKEFPDCFVSPALTLKEFANQNNED